MSEKNLLNLEEPENVINNFVIWTYGPYKQIAEKAVELFDEMDFVLPFVVEELFPNEIYDRLTYINTNEEWQSLPDLILVPDMLLRKYIRTFPHLFATMDSIDTSVVTDAKRINVTYLDRVYGCPCSSEPVALYYNRHFLAGYIRENMSWYELREVGIELKERYGVYLFPPEKYLLQILMQSTGNLYYDYEGKVVPDSANEIIELIEYLHYDGLIYPENPDLDEIALEEDVRRAFANNEIIAVIGGPEWYTKIKAISKEQEYAERWDVATIPKEYSMNYEVDLGGCSWMLVDKAQLYENPYNEICSKDDIIYLLMELFNQENEYSLKFYKSVAELYDMVPAVSFAGNLLDDLPYDIEIFETNVMKFLFELREFIPEIYYGKYTEELTKELENIIKRIITGEISAGDGYDEFSGICNEYLYELDPPLTLDHIVIIKDPECLNYYDGEYFDESGMIVRAYFIDGTHIIIEDYSCSPRILHEKDTYVEVSYSSGGVTDTVKLPVTVEHRNVVGISATARKDFYLHGHTLTCSDFSVRAKYDAGKDGYLDSFLISPETLKNLGDQIITIKTSDEKFRCNVTIKVIKKLTGLEIVSPPYRTEYIEGEYFNKTGLKVKALYCDGSSKDIEKYSILQRAKLSNEKNITISYKENEITCTVNQAITVNKKSLTKITANGLKQKDYIVGEYLDRTGLVVKAYYNNNTSKRIENYTIVDEDKPLTEENNKIKIDYSEDGIECFAEINITVVSSDLTGLRVDKLLRNKYLLGYFDPRQVVMSAQYGGKVWRKIDYNSNDIEFDLENISEPGIQTVTAKYTENNQTVSTNFSIIVLKGGLEYIQVKDMPNTRRCFVGDTLSTKGMSLYGYYGYKEKAEKLLGDISSTTELKFGDRYADVCYDNAEDGKYYVKVPVTVFERYVDSSVNGQAELNYNCDAGEAGVNLFTGRLAFEHFDASIGVNDYQLSCSHIYNSQFDEQTSLEYNATNYLHYKTGMGKGFKLSIQQYLIWDNENKRYIYTDGAGYRHSFVSLGDGERYYDTTGTDLLLKADGNGYVIYDVAGNKMYFENGVLVKTVSCYNSNAIKKFVYNTKGLLVEAYDERNKSDKIVFEYDEESGLLLKLKCLHNGKIAKTIEYTYVNKSNLNCLSMITDADKKTVFVYSAFGVLKYVADLQTNSCLEFDYNSSGEYISEVIVGVANIAIDENSLVKSIDIPDGNVKQRNVISSDVNRYIVTVRNQKGKYQNSTLDVVMNYYFNAQGNTTAVLEVNEESSIYDLRSLEKLPGTSIELTDSGTTYGTINTRPIYKSFNDIEYMYPSEDNLKALTDYRRNKCNNYDNFAISFWIKLDRVLIDPRMQVLVNSSNGIFSDYYETAEFVLDNSAIGVWQFVTVPVKILGDNIKSIEFLTYNDYNEDISISDIRFYSTPHSKWFLKGENESSWAPLDSAKKLVYTLANVEYGNPEKIENFNENCFMTEKDLHSTIISMYQERTLGEKLSGTSNFILSLCNGTRKLWVKEASLIATNVKDGVNNVCDFPLGLETVAETSEDPIHGLALFNYEMRSPDDMLVSHVYMNIYPSIDIDGEKRDVIKERTVATLQGKDKKTSETYTYADMLGRTLREVDEYGVTVTYEYDSNGQVCKKTVSHKDTSEKIVYEASHSSTDSTEQSKVGYSNTVYGQPLGNVTKLISCGNGEQGDLGKTLVTSFEYDNNHILSKVKNSLNGQNTFAYTNGRLSSVLACTASGTPEYGYSFVYDIYGNPSEYYLLNSLGKAVKKLSSKTVDYSNGTTQITQYRKSEQRPDTVKVTLDKYGRTASIEEMDSNWGLSRTTEFKRQDLWESAGASEVTEMSDPFEKCTYSYYYDENNKCTGYSAKDASSKEEYFNIQKTGENEVTYYKDLSDSRVSKIDYDSEKLISPRIVSVNDMAGRKQYFTGSLPNSVDSDIGITKYEYDELGRLSQKSIQATYYENDDIDNKYTYLDGTTLVKEIAVNYSIDNTEQSKSFKYAYDTRGRITHVGSTSNSSAPTFVYDNANRLVKENSGDFVCLYDYNADGSLKSETVSGTKIDFTYENGRLIKHGNDTFEYDNIGNCVNYKGKTLSWGRGNLLTQYGDSKEATYGYDAQGVRFKKVVNGVTTRFFHDGAKIINELCGDTSVSYLYDANEIIGFKANDNYYYFVKDIFSNVRSILMSKFSPKLNYTDYDLKEVARYEYDAWGNCTVTSIGNETINGISVAEFNPIRWKSQYYDRESGFYYIGGRYYSPEIKRYINPANVETVLSNAATIYALNLYALTLTNPLQFGGICYTIFTNTELAYDPPELSAWDRFWQSTTGKLVAVVLLFVATIACILTHNIPALLATMGLTAGSLIVGGAIAGYQSYVCGKGFWRGFERYINGNWAQSIAIASITLLITCGISAIASAVQNSGSNQPLPNGNYEVSDAVIETRDGVTIQIASKKDFTRKARKALRKLRHNANGETISNASVGREIHKGFKVGMQDKILNAGRTTGKYGFVDAIDWNKRIIWELKPNNARSIAMGIKQLHRYNNALGGGYKLILVLY